MAQLDGEIIERMLFEEGFEFELYLDPDTLINYLKITGGSATIRLSEIWTEDDNWFIDSYSCNIEADLGDNLIDLSDTPIHDEHSLVARIVDAVVLEMEEQEAAAEAIGADKKTCSCD